MSEEKDLTARVNSGDSDPGVSARLTEVYTELEAIDSASAPARAAIILSGLGFTTQMQVYYTTIVQPFKEGIY